MEEEKKRNGWQHFAKALQWDIQFIKETLLNLDRKITEQVIKHQHLEEKVNKMEEDIRKRQFQTFYAILGAVLSFLTGLLIFILSSLVRGR
ncbi:MAG: hypothetical protein ABDH28_00705 [Brevinematia bacterium]